MRKGTQHTHQMAGYKMQICATFKDKMNSKRGSAHILLLRKNMYEAVEIIIMMMVAVEVVVLRLLQQVRFSIFLRMMISVTKPNWLFELRGSVH